MAEDPFRPVCITLSSKFTEESQCPACMSKGRRLESLRALAHPFNALVNSYKHSTENYDNCELRETDELCWECTSVLRKICKFIRQVHCAKNNLNSCDFITSNLTHTSKLGWNFEIDHDDIPVIKEELNQDLISEPDLYSTDIKIDQTADIKLEIESENENDSLIIDEIATENGAKKSKYNYTKKTLSEHEMRMRRDALSHKKEYVNCDFKCETCIKSFGSKITLNRHNELLHSEESGRFECDICKVRYGTSFKLLKHSPVHYTVYSCNDCDFDTSFYNKFSMHYLKAHSRDEESLCDKCGKAFLDAAKLRTHKRSHRKIYCTCDYCGKQMTKSNLIRHIQLHTGQPLLPCKQCGHLCRGLDSYRYHIKSKHTPNESQNELYCVECNIKFKTSMNLKNHLEKTKRHAEHNMKYNCDKCPGKFLTEWAMKFHIKRHHVQKKCEECGLMLTSLYGWQTHMKRQHSQSEPEFTCHICNKTIKRKHRIAEHMRTHTGERPLVCNICGDTFRQSSALYTHTKLKHKQAKACR